MKLEKRAQSASEETAAQIPAAPAAENGRHKPVLLYLVILFAIAFVLILFSFIMHQRSNAEVLKELQSQVETLQELQQVEEQYKAVSEENKALREQVDALTKQAEADARTHSALLLVWKLERLYAAGDDEGCLAAIEALQQDDLYLALPNETDEGEMYETPRAAYDRILEALSNTAG